VKISRVLLGPVSETCNKNVSKLGGAFVECSTSLEHGGVLDSSGKAQEWHVIREEWAIQ